jgi:Immunity protein 27
MVGGRIVADAVCDRIEELIQKHLEKVATTGWDTLYRDPQDGRHWELLYLHSEMHGGGPPTLVLVEETTAGEKYALENHYGAMTVNERLVAAGLLDDFDRAVGAGDVRSLKAILRDVQLGDENIAAILKRVLPDKTP